MDRETFNILVTNIALLNSNDEDENRLKNLISKTFKTQYRRL